MPPRALTAAFAACLFLIIVSAKWATFDRYGSPMPDWDQWDAEAGEALVPWYTNDQVLTHLFNPHNEHRVILTKLQNLALTVINGQWDARLQAVGNAVLHAAIAAGLWVFGRRRLAGHWQAAYFILLVALFAPPVAWQNVLGGFHSQQYWLVGLSFVALLTLPFVPTWSKLWWLGAIAATLVLGSMGSGLLAAAAAAGMIAWRWLRREMTLREAAPTLALAAVLIAIGLLTRVDVEYHQHMRAKSVHDFVFSIVHSLQWPWRDAIWAALLLWTPWFCVAWQTLTAKRPIDSNSPDSSRADWRFSAVITALGGWVLLQVAATAYARGAGADYPASRYMDTLSFGAAVNGLALAWLLTHFASRRPPLLATSAQGGRHSRTPSAVGAALRRDLNRDSSRSFRGIKPLLQCVGSFPSRGALFALSLAWAITLGVGLHAQLTGTFESELPDAKKYYVKAEANMRRYLSTMDAKHLANQDIPYPSAQGIIDRLVEPSLRALMPVPIRPPLPVEVQPASAATFIANDARNVAPETAPRRGLSPATPPLDHTISWGSYDPAQGAAAQGEWRSRPLPPVRGHGWLRFETAGHPGAGGIALEVRDATTDGLLATVRPTNTPGDGWRPVYVRAPRVPFVIVAQDRDPTRWLAFSGPVEMGTLSHAARMATKHSLVVLYSSAAATIVLALIAAAMTCRRPEPASLPVP